ncbi:TolC family protein [Curvibacter delicatus]|jgi:cobalt-zinc-cadmium efflux system outer membrane protein|uniref:TolC family protein n=1 Tax=Curvibacter delicatus TaxID=80879 RepID=UPI00082E266C|nr:TolC family protein [Curvibacter delicatus]
MFIGNFAGGGAWLRALGIMAGISLAIGAARAAATPLTLEDAWRLAEAANSTLRAAQAGLSAAEGQLRDASGLFYNNPTLSTDQTSRRTNPNGQPENRFHEQAIGIFQTFEIAGQAGFRRSAAEQDLAATRMMLEETRRQVRAEVEQRFARVLVLERRIDAERDAVAAVEEAASAVRRRMAAGEDSRLDSNLATVEAERGRNQLAALTEQLLQAREELAAILQLPADNVPVVAGELNAGAPTYTLDALLVSAAKRSQLQALEHREEAAHRRLDLENASVVPDVTLGLSVGQDAPYDSREQFTRLTLSVPLPLFRRNAAGIGKAATELSQAQIERESTIRNINAQVRTLWQRLDSLRERVKRLTESVYPALDENRRLSTTAYRAGEIGLLQLLLVNRQLLDARRDYLDAVGEFVQTRIALEQAAGWHADLTEKNK